MLKNVFVCTVVTAFLSYTIVQCCENPSFQDVKVKASKTFSIVKDDSKDVNLLQHFTGCITPIDEFKNALTITITNQNIPILYQSSVNDLVWLHELILDDNNIETLEAEAFNNLESLVTISLQNNKITTIPKGVFNNMNIKRLLLNNNQINTIESSAFDNMPGLYKIALDHNNIQKWNSEWFTNSPSVELLSVSHNNIKELPADSFKNIHGAHKNSMMKTSIFLNNNKISKIDQNAFKGLSELQFLDLERNEIAELTTEFSGIKSVAILSLSGNKIKCLLESELNSLPNAETINMESNPLDCECLTQMQQWSKKHKKNLKVYIRKVECMQERIMKTLAQVKDRELVVDDVETLD